MRQPHLERSIGDEPNNVFGIIRTAGGFGPLVDALRRMIPEADILVRRSAFDGTEKLRFHADRAEFDSTPLEQPDEHLFNGRVNGSLEEIGSFVRSLSEHFRVSRIGHQFEVYDEDDELVLKVLA